MSVQQVAPQQTLETGHQDCLSRPVYLAHTRAFVWGSQSYYSSNHIYWCLLNEGTRQIQRVQAMELPQDVIQSQYVSDIAAIDGNSAAVAIGAHMCMLRMNGDAGPEIRPFAALSTHVDDVRELCYNSATALLGAAGHDEHLHLLSVSERRGHVHSFHNGDVVSSVRCLPTGSASIFSCTTDSGYLNIFDVRQAKLAASINSHTPQLYSHTYLDEHLILCGYNSNSLKLFDTRTMTCTGSVFDPVQEAIGDLQTATSSDSRTVLAVGAPGWTLWECPLGADSVLAFEPRLQFTGAAPQPQQEALPLSSCISGAALCSDSSADMFLCTTSAGTALFFDVSMYPRAAHAVQV